LIGRAIQLDLFRSNFHPGAPLLQARTLYRPVCYVRVRTHEPSVQPDPSIR
jgi:hypothetical protein